MPRRKPRHEERPWQPDPIKWAKLLEVPKSESSKMSRQIEPKSGWQLWDWRTLEDKPQN